MPKEKKNRPANLRELNIPELKEKLLTARRNLFEQEIKRTELKNPLKLRWMRRDIARILTVIKEKETEGTSAGK